MQRLKANAAAGGLDGEPEAALFLGGNSDYTRVGISQRYVAGAVAQAAFFTNALTAVQIQELYRVALVPAISMARIGNGLVISYTGVLLSSTSVAGTYTVVSDATSPYTVPQDNAQRFYRARNP